VNIIACVKQVPDTEAQIKVKGDGSGIDEGGIKWVMNPYDEYGVEEALKLKEKLGGEVTVVCVGPARAMETIRTALAMGAEKGIHICDPALDNADAYTTAAALAAAIKGIPYDIIFCGQRAIDDDSGQVGSVLADLLGIPQFTIVMKVDIDGQKIQAVKPIEGAQLVIDGSLPCVVTATKGLNEPRYETLKGIMMAKKKEIPIISIEELGFRPEDLASGVEITGMEMPPARQAGKVVTGTPEETARQLVGFLHNDAKII
jgi:electron transfer flavoprotein beta subunit